MEAQLEKEKARQEQAEEALHQAAAREFRVVESEAQTDPLESESDEEGGAGRLLRRTVSNVELLCCCSPRSFLRHRDQLLLLGLV